MDSDDKTKLTGASGDSTTASGDSPSSRTKSLAKQGTSKAAGAIAGAAGVPGGSSIANKLGRNKGKLIGAGIFGVIIIIALIIAFFLSLFKLNHIEKLFLSFEMAATNRTMNERINEILAENKANPNDPLATGTDTTTPAAPDAPLTEQLSKANADELTQAEASPMDNQTYLNKLDTVDLSVDGTQSHVNSEYNITEADNLPSEPDNAPQDKVNQDVQKEAARESASAEAPSAAALPDEIKDPAQEATQQVEGGAASSDVLPQIAASAPEQVHGIPGTSAIFVAVIFCTVYDVVHQGAHKLATMMSSGLIQNAVTLFHANSKQKLGQLSASQVGGYNNMYDNGKASFTQTSAYDRVNQVPDSHNTPLDTTSRPFDAGNSPMGQLFNTAAGTNVAGQAISSICSVVTNPVAQFTVGAAGLIIAVTGAFDGGASDVGEGAVSAIVTEYLTKYAIGAGIAYAGTQGLKAIISLAISKYTGLALLDHHDPVQNTEKLDAGSDLISQESAHNKGGHKLSAPVAAQMRSQAIADLKLRIKSHGPVYAFLNFNNPFSPAAQLLAAIPSTPQQMLSRSAQYMATLFSPLQWGPTLAMALPSGSAIAAPAPTADPYGIPQYGLTDAELNEYGFKDNSLWIESHTTSQERSELDKCYDTRISDIETKPDSDLPSINVNWFPIYDKSGHIVGYHHEFSYVCNNPDERVHRYHLYRLDRRIVQNMVDIGNNTSQSGSAASGSSSQTGNVNPGGLAWPEPTTSIITQCYTGPVGVGHPGVDIAAPPGTPIFAADAGVVYKAGPADGYGPNFVIIKHGSGYYTSYGHMASMSVTEGQTVTQGQQIGTEGSQGESTGPHLHFNLTLGTDDPSQLYNGNFDPLMHGLAIPAGVANPHNCPTS